MPPSFFKFTLLTIVVCVFPIVHVADIPFFKRLFVYIII